MATHGGRKARKMTRNNEEGGVTSLTHTDHKTAIQNTDVPGVLGLVVAMPVEAAAGTHGTTKACAAAATRARTPRTLQEEDDEEGDACLEPPSLLLDTMVGLLATRCFLLHLWLWRR